MQSNIKYEAEFILYLVGDTVNQTIMLVLFTSLLACLTPASSMTISLSNQTHMMKSEEEKEERNSKLSAQHFLPGNPQTQAFPRPTGQLTGSDRGFWQRGQLWCPRKSELRVRARVGTGAVQQLQMGEWLLGSKIIADLSADMSFGRENEIKRCSFCEGGLVNALTGAENSEGGLIYCLPSVALSFAPPESSPPVLQPLLTSSLISFHSALVLRMLSLVNVVEYECFHMVLRTLRLYSSGSHVCNSLNTETGRLHYLQ